MSFFFKQPPKRSATGQRVNKLKVDVTHFAERGCHVCPLDAAERTLHHAKMRPTGSKRPDVLILGEAPGETEDLKGEQFVGKSGEYLRERLPTGVNYRFNNSLRCHPPKNRNPTDVELLCCMPKQTADIVATKPAVVLAVGGIPLSALVGVGQITAMRGRKLALHLPGHSCWLVPTFHPSYLLRLGGSQNRHGPSENEKCFIDDLEYAVSLIDAPPPSRYMFDRPDKDIEQLTKSKDIIAALASLAKSKRTATDIETNKLRPYSEDAKILTAAVSDGRRTIAFPIHHPGANFTDAQRKLVLAAYRDYLTSTVVYCHNANFEAEWFVHEYGPSIAYDIDLHDTMAQAFVLDERQGLLGLDDLCLINFGINLKQLAKLDKNNLTAEPLTEVLAYNGRDARYTYALAVEQEEALEAEELTEVYEMQRSRVMAVVLAQFIGVTPNSSVVKAFSKELETKIAELGTKLVELPSVKKFVDAYRENFNPASNPQLSKALKFLKLVSANVNSTDESVLANIDHPLPQMVLELRGLEKLNGTYIKPLLPGGKHVHADNLIHCRFNHLVTSTGRLSAQDPNLQNYPKREGGSKYRQVIRARKGRAVLSIDYGQIEYRVIGMATNDKAIIKSLFEDADIHMVWAQKLLRRYPKLIGRKAKLKDEKAVKEFRSRVKNSLVFPAFYGSSINSISTSFGLSPDDLQDLFDEFWDEFRGVKQWQQQLMADFEENRYVECLTGRRRHAPMSYNAVINSPIQGTASDIVVDGMERLSRHAIASDQLFMHPIMNVHDDLTFDFPSDDEQFFEESIQFIAREMLDCKFPFINVPLTVEVSVGPTWGEVQEVAKFSSLDFGIKPPATLRRKARR